MGKLCMQWLEAQMLRVEHAVVGVGSDPKKRRLGHIVRRMHLRRWDEIVQHVFARVHVKRSHYRKRAM